jgi:hypothetical protein
MLTTPELVDLCNADMIIGNLLYVMPHKTFIATNYRYRPNVITLEFGRHIRMNIMVAYGEEFGCLSTVKQERKRKIMLI